ncbi:hypothetical protein [Candidatus Tisiphia endosymbiont of Piscicola geometra]|uniref:hypothetical protein n=1 Tax=Candidatus Tisiphia endosymbiont of Piscicola geometra TaxID=3066273 RepID=UPI00312C8B6D
MPFGYLNGISSKYAKLPEKEKRRTRLMAVETENVLMITSLEKKSSPEELLKFNRSHWSCENNLNWIKDKVFEEDKSTISVGEAPLIMSLLRTTTLSIIALFSNKITETRENFNNYRHRLFKLFST